MKARKIERAKLLPLGCNDQRIGGFGAVINILTITTFSSTFCACLIPAGANARISAPISCKAAINESEGASRISSVFGLNVSPSTATVLPRRAPEKMADTFWAIARRIRQHRSLTDEELPTAM